MVAVLVVPGWTIAAWMRQVVVPRARMIDGIATILVATVCTLGVLHVGVLVDDGHHVGDGLGVALEHLSSLFDAMEALVEVVDHVNVMNFRNHVTVSKVPLDVVP